MASPQVLSNSSRKQGHLEAGKRRLEEFRKKKAAERTKKASSNDQPHSANIISVEKLPLGVEQVQNTGSDGVGESNRTERAFAGPSLVGAGGSIINNALNDRTGFSKDLKAETTLINDNNPDSTRSDGFRLGDPVDVNYGDHTSVKDGGFIFQIESLGRLAHDSSSKESSAPHQDVDYSAGHHSFIGTGDGQLTEKSSSLNAFSFPNIGVSRISDSNVSFENSGSFSQHSKANYSSIPENDKLSLSYKDSVDVLPRMSGTAHELRQYKHASSAFNGPMVSDTRHPIPISSVGNSMNVFSEPFRSSEPTSTSFNLDFRNTSQQSSMDEFNARRSRPSFLDSINISKSSTSLFSINEREKSSLHSSNASEAPPMISHESPSETLNPLSESGATNGLAFFEHATNSSVFTANGVDQQRPGITEFGMAESDKSDLKKHDENFFGLEQHIEDLTQEKFSLQRTLEASRALAESLAAENSALTDSYNQQGGLISQLKSDIQQLQEEIKSQQVEFESIKAGYANAQLECNAADERAKLLASEVIGLEEKALRLRSNELKLERQLEKSQAENFSCKKKISSLERDCQDYHSTVDALREETRLLQSKLRKVSVSGNSIDVSRITSMKKEASTSTEDLDSEDSMYLGASNLEMSSPPINDSDISEVSLRRANGLPNLDASSVNIPSDQMKMIYNINALISELSLEKEELMRVLTAELSNCSHLKQANAELSRKLEAQTQRLELLTTQSMANKSTPVRQPDVHNVQENTAYADEGDEVVERVLGWIMKLFPGGPSRRRTIKLI